MLLTSIVLGGSIDNTSDNHEDAAENNARLAAVSIDDSRHSEHREDRADGEHVGQEAEEVGLGLVRSDIVKVLLPVVVLLQKVEEGSIITGGGRTDQKTKGAVDVELADVLVLGPGDLLELRSFSNGLLPIFLGTGGDIR